MSWKDFFAWLTGRPIEKKFSPALKPMQKTAFRLVLEEERDEFYRRLVSVIMLFIVISVVMMGALVQRAPWDLLATIFLFEALLFGIFIHQYVTRLRKLPLSELMYLEVTVVAAFSSIVICWPFDLLLKALI